MSTPHTALTTPDGASLTVADVVVDTFRGAGVDRVFCLAGESYLAVLDALFDRSDVDVVGCRHEASAGFAAIADAKLTGRPGVCLVNRGPGAGNAAVAVHSAAQDATPLVILVGQVKRADLGRGGFQEVDYTSSFATLAKATIRLYEPSLAAECTQRALRLAASGTPGPVILEVPEDVLAMPTETGPRRSWAPDPLRPAPAVVRRVQDLITAAARPILIAGGRLGSDAGRQRLRQAAAEFALPVIASNKRQDLIDNHDQHYCGHLHNSTSAAQRAAWAESDLIIAVGTRLDDVTTRGHRFPPADDPVRPLIHVYPDPAELDQFHRPTVGVACDPAEFLAALCDAIPTPVPAQRTEWLARLRQLEIDNALWHPETADDGLVFGAVVSALDSLTGGDIVVTVDSGTFTSWVYRYLRFSQAGRLLGVTSSAMGFGLPAALAAALRLRRTAVSIIGDGGLVMNCGELATAVERRARLVVIVANNGSYGTIRMHQELRYPGRVMATDLLNPDFAALAEAFGATGLTVRSEAELVPTLSKALDLRSPVVVDITTSLHRISAYRTLTPSQGTPP